MNKDYKSLIPEDFDNASKVWIYQSSRLFTMSEALEIEDMLNDFVQNWRSHGDEVKGYGNLFFGQFVVLMADERQSGVSGCSTDSSVRFIKSVEKEYNVELLDRQTLAFIVKNKILLVPLEDVNLSIENEIINPETLYFNNTILTKKQLLNDWIIPVKDSWLAKRIPSSHL